MTNYIELMVMLPTIVLLAVIDYNMQKLTGKKIYYGVNIPEKYRDYEELKSVDKNYKRGILISTFAIIIIQVGLSIYANFMLNEALYILAISVPILLIVCLYFLIYYKSYKKVLAFKEEHLSSIVPELKSEKTRILDVDFMNERNKLVKKYSLIYLIPMILMVASVVYSFLNYDKIPEMMPTHFNIQGVADGFTEKTKTSFFGQVSLQIIVMIVIYFSSISSLKSRVKVDKKNSAKDKAYTIKYLNLLASSSFFMMMSMVILFGCTSFGLFTQKISQPLMILSTVILLVSIIPLIYASSKLKKGSSSDISYTVDDDDKYWVLGALYNNPDDPSAFVQKRFGIGWTVNIGSKKGKFMILAILLLILISLYISFKFSI